MEGLVVRSTGLWYSVEVNGEVKSARLRGKLRLKGLKTSNPVAVGDVVMLREDKNGEFLIEDVKERKNYLIRKSTKLSAQAHIVASNIDHALLVMTLKNPRTSVGFAERFLVTTEAYGVSASVYVNKVDEFEEEERLQFQELEEMYQRVGVPIYELSVQNGTGMERLRKRIQGKRTLLTGHSGAGKSSLLNALNPDLSLVVGEVSASTSKGKHTTTFAQLYRIDTETEVIDSPGIKEIGLYNMNADEVSNYYPEIRAIQNDCKFNDCTHFREPGCVVHDAVANGRVSELRYENYLKIITSEDVVEGNE
jgi:ribosome biogenesis GTPase